MQEEPKANGKSSTSCFLSNIPEIPICPIMEMILAYRQDTHPNKVDLGVGAYRDDDGKPYVLPIVQKVEQEIASDFSLSKEYPPLDGEPDYLRATRMVLFGFESPMVQDPRIITTHTLSGTEAVFEILALLKKFNEESVVYVSDPTWANYPQILRFTGQKMVEYRYYNEKTMDYDFEGMIEDISCAPSGSIIVLQTCGHNPTGFDPTKEQWAKIAAVVKERRLFPLFDSPYLGFVSSDLGEDAFAVSYFIEQGLEMAITQSYSKNMGLYGEKAGALHFVCKEVKHAENIRMQLNMLCRQTRSPPPVHGGRIVSRIVLNPAYREEWLKEVEKMSNMMRQKRKMLYDELVAIKAGGERSWDKVLTSRGMFWYSGITKKQVEAIREKHHVMMAYTGRISICGVTSKNVKYVAQAIKDVVENY